MPVRVIVEVKVMFLVESIQLHFTSYSLHIRSKILSLSLSDELSNKLLDCHFSSPQCSLSLSRVS